MALPLLYAGVPKKERRERAIEALKLMLNKLCVGIIVGYKAKLTPTGCHILNDIADFSLLKTDKIVVFLQ